MMLESIKTKMQKFNSLTSIPVYLPIVNIDTDMIIPKQFLKTIKRTGLGKNLFFEMRYDDNGNEIKDFILKSRTSQSIKNINCRKKLWLWFIKRACAMGTFRFWNYMCDKL